MRQCSRILHYAICTLAIAAIGCGPHPKVCGDYVCELGEVCTADGQACKPTTCDGNAIDDGEECDGTHIPQECTDLGYLMGATTCSESCTVDTSRCIQFNSVRIDTPPCYSNDGGVQCHHFARAWGKGLHDLHVVGRIGERFDINPMLEAGFPDGAIWHYDGEEWTHEVFTDQPGLVDIWGNSSGDELYAVGAWGTILHNDGREWRKLDQPHTEKHLLSVWGSDSSDVFVAGTSITGDDGSIFHYDGMKWSETQTEEGIFGIWGRSYDDVYAVGEKGTLLHFDGTAWIELSHSGNAWVDVWGSDSGQVYIVGGSGTLVRYDEASTTFEDMVAEKTAEFFAVWGTSSQDVFAAGSAGTILHYDGNDQNVWHVQHTGVESELTGIVEDHRHPVFIGQYSTVLARGKHTLDRMNSALQEDIHDLWLDDTGLALALTADEKILSFDRNRGIWDFESSLPIGGPCRVHGDGMGRAYVVGLESMSYYDGSTWTVPHPDLQRGFTAVWVHNPDEVYFGNGYGSLFRYRPEQNVFELLEQGGDAWHITALWGFSSDDIYAVDQGEVRRWDGSRWSLEELHLEGNLGPLQDIWGADGELFAVGGSSTILHRKPHGEWERMSQNVYLGEFTRVWGSAPDDVFATSMDGPVLHYDGVRWTPVNLDADGTPGSRAVWGTDREVLFAGSGGVIYRMRGHRKPAR